MAGIYGTMSISHRPRGGALPVYQGSSGVYAPGADMSGRLSDSAGRLFGAAGEEEANAWGKAARAADNAVQTGLAAYEDYSKSKATQLLDEYRRRMREAMYGENGILTRKGEAAFTADDDVAARSREVREQVLGEYGDSLVGNFFAMRAREVDADNLLAAQKYKGDEFRTWQNRNDLAAAEEAADRARAWYNSPEQFGKAAAEALWHTRERLARDGYGGEALERELKEVSSGIFKGGIEQALAANDLAGARRLLAEGSGESGRMTSADIAVSGASIKAHAKRLEEQAKANARRAQETRLTALSASVWESTKGLPAKEREEAAIESIAAMTADPKERRALYAAFNQDLQFQKIREDAEASRMARELVEMGRREKMPPTQFKAMLAARVSNEEARKRADALYMGELQETPQNRENMKNIFVAIDQRQVRNGDELEALIINGRLTEKQAREARDYMDSGGKMGKLSFENLNKRWKNLGGPLENDRMPLDVYEALKVELADGKQPNEQELNRALSLLAMPGATPGRDSWFTISGTRNEPYYQALQAGRGGEWLPDITPEEYRQYSAEMQQLGLSFVSYPMAREYKKVRAMGIAPSPDSSLRDLWARLEKGEQP